MPSRRVHNTHICEQVRALHDALLDIVGAINRPQGDEMIVREAGMSLDRALFPLLVVIERRGPIGVVDLAGQVGRDYTTVSRQIDKLEGLGLIERRSVASDRRISESAVTSKGKAMIDAVDRARERLVGSMFATWDAHDVKELIRLMRKFAEAVSGKNVNKKN